MPAVPSPAALLNTIISGRRGRLGRPGGAGRPVGKLSPGLRKASVMLEWRPSIAASQPESIREFATMGQLREWPKAFGQAPCPTDAGLVWLTHQKEIADD